MKPESERFAIGTRSGGLSAKRRAIFYRSFTIMTFLSVLPFSLAFLAQAQDSQQVIIEVLGTSCPFCAFGLEKTLGEIKGVADVKIELKAGKAIVTLQKGAKISEDALRQAVDDAGFTPGKIMYRSADQQEKAR